MKKILSYAATLAVGLTSVLAMSQQSHAAPLNPQTIEANRVSVSAAANGEYESNTPAPRPPRPWTSGGGRPHRPHPR